VPSDDLSSAIPRKLKGAPRKLCRMYHLPAKWSSVLSTRHPSC